MPKINPVLTQEQFEQLHRDIDTRRTVVKVDRQALANLLMDHSELWAALGIT